LLDLNFPPSCVDEPVMPQPPNTRPRIAAAFF
jgi:hypothetical protein